MTNYFLGARFFCPKSLRHKILLTSIRVSGSFLGRSFRFCCFRKYRWGPGEQKIVVRGISVFGGRTRNFFARVFCAWPFSHTLSPTLSLSLAFTLCLYLPRASLSLFPLPFSPLFSLLSPSPRRVFSSSRPRYFLLGGKKSWRIMIGASKANRKPRWRESQRLTSTAKSKKAAKKIRSHREAQKKLEPERASN